MKVKPGVKKICDNCKIIRRHRRVMVSHGYLWQPAA